MENNPDSSGGKGPGDEQVNASQSEALSPETGAGKESGNGSDGAELAEAVTPQAAPEEEPQAVLSGEDTGVTEVPVGPDGLLPAGELLSAAWQGTKERLGKFFSTMVLFFVALLALIVAGILLGGALAYAKLEVLMLVPILFGIILIFYLALIQRVMLLEIAADAELPLREVAGKASSKVVPLLKLVFCYLLIICVFVCVLSLTMILPAFVIGTLSNGSVAGSLLLVLISIALVVACLIAFILLGAMQQFATFAVVLEDMPVVRSMAYSWGVVMRHWKGLLRRFLYLAAVYIVILLPFIYLSERSTLGAFIYQLVGFVLSCVSLLFAYILYKNVKGIDGTDVSENDVRTVRKLIKGGALLNIIAVAILAIIVLFGVMMAMRSTGSSDHIPYQGYPSTGSAPAI
jgi:hypothetical protein